MKRTGSLFTLLWMYCHLLPCFGQNDLPADNTIPLLDWQEQILLGVDIDNIGNEAYELLLDELSDAVLWSDTASTPFLSQRIRQQIILSSNRTLSTREGYRDANQERRQNNKAYLGDPWHQTLRYRLSWGKEWKAGFCLDKDPGEAWQGRFPIFDSAQGFIVYQSDNRRATPLRQAIIGNYRLQMGCGLVINQSFSLGKQYVSQQFLKRSNIFRPFASTSESDYMQGAAFQFRFGEHLTLLPYASAVQLDGTLNEHHILTSIKTDGQHRTDTENARRSTAWQSTFGLRAGWQGEWYDLGLHLTTTQLQYDYQRNALYYNQNYFRGHQLSHVSADYHIRPFGCVMRGEIAIDDKGGLALLNLLSRNISNYWQASLVHRYYSSHYRQLHAASLSESSGLQGERGLTLQLNGELSRYWTLQLMGDLFHFSQPQYDIHETTSNGYEGIANATYKRKKTSASLSFRTKRKGDYTRHSFFSYFTLSPTNALTFRTQFKYRIHQEDGLSQGFVFSQAGTWNSATFRPAWNLSLSAQATYFDTDDYDSRLYVTEKNVPYGFGLPMLYGQGVRYSSTASLHMGARFIADLKWALTNYANCRSISTGLQQIASNTQQDLWIQLRMKF